MLGPRTLLAVVLALGMSSNLTHAQTDVTRLPEEYVALKSTLGFAGAASVSSSRKTLSGVGIGAFDASSDLEESFGGAVQYIFAAHRYLGLGSSFGVQSWRSDRAATNGDGRSLALDLALVPLGRVPLGDRFEVYLALPLGLTLSLLNEAKAWVELHALNDPILGKVEDVDPTFGFSLSVLLGLRFALADRFGLFTEVGYARRQFLHPVDVRFREATASGERVDSQEGTSLDFNFVTEQFAWNLGVFF